MIRSLVITTIFLLVSTQAIASTLEGKVSAVIDGSTFVIQNKLGQHTIRLMYVRAPEKDQPYGEVSRNNLIEMILGKTVTVEYEKSDRYKWIIGKVLVDPPGDVFCLAIGCVKKVDVGLAQIQAGLAWYDKKNQNKQSEEDLKYYLEAESVAREQRLGLWKK